MTNGIRWGGCALALCLSLGCGGDEPSAGVPMAATATANDAAPAVGGANRPPVVDRVEIRPESPGPGQTVRAEVQASDPDGDDLSLSYTWRVAGRVQPSGGPEMALQGVNKGDQVAVTVAASDGGLESAAVDAWAVVANQAPLLHSVVFEPMGELTSSQDLRARPRAVDDDGDLLSYRFRWWVNDQLQAAEDEVLPNEVFSRGDSIEVEVIASDGEADSEAIRSPALRVGNGDPSIVSSPPAVDAEGVFRYQVRAEDPDGDRRLRYRVVEGPPGMQVDNVLGSVVWRPGDGETGRFPVVLAVEDMQGGEATQRFELILGENPPANQAVSP